MTQIVLHIGLPKTGSTTLQADVFPYLAEKSDLNYIGLWQPARGKQHPLTSALHRWFANGEQASEARALLAEWVGRSRLLISNEAIHSSTVTADWRLRVQRVAELTVRYDVCYYLCVREPAAAMFSYFAEHFVDAPTGHFSRFSDAAQRDPRLQIYRYKATIPYLQSVLGDRLVIEAYEDVFRGRSDFLASLTPDGRPFPEAIGRHNVKQGTAEAVVLRESATLRDRLRQAVYATPIGQSRWARGVIASMAPVTRALDRVRLGRVEVPRPSEAEFARLRETLREDIIYLRDHFGIDYLGAAASGERPAVNSRQAPPSGRT